MFSLPSILVESAHLSKKGRRTCWTIVVMFILWILQLYSDLIGSWYFVNFHPPQRIMFFFKEGGSDSGRLSRVVWWVNTIRPGFRSTLSAFSSFANSSLHGPCCSVSSSSSTQEADYSCSNLWRFLLAEVTNMLEKWHDITYSCWIFKLICFFINNLLLYSVNKFLSGSV